MQTANILYEKQILLALFFPVQRTIEKQGAQVKV